jgi:hypothetical protein
MKKNLTDIVCLLLLLSKAQMTGLNHYATHVRAAAIVRQSIAKSTG